MMPCKNALSASETYSLCVLNLYGGKPSHGTCAQCEKCTDPEWHRQKVAEMLAKQPPPPVSSIVVPTVDILPVPKPQWPLWTATIALLATPEDAGIGDTVERLAKRAGAKSLVEWTKEHGLPDCGCADRKRRWNQQYPYQAK